MYVAICYSSKSNKPQRFEKYLDCHDTQEFSQRFAFNVVLPWVRSYLQENRHNKNKYSLMHLRMITLNYQHMT